MTPGVRRMSLLVTAVLILAALALIEAPAQSSGARTVSTTGDVCVEGTTKPADDPHHEGMLRVAAPISGLPGAVPPSQSTLPGSLTVLPNRVNIPVRVHVIRGKHRKENGPTRPRVRALIRILNGGFAGNQSADSAPTRFRFNLKSIRYVKNDSWYHAYNFTPADNKAKRRLHQGTKRTLNVYINGGSVRNQPVLGWSRLPWQRASSPKLDGVSINVAAMPGGRAANYNLGDTIIHETGHWLGLLHPWQGGCKAPNDGVADTPATAGPSYYCDEDADTCAAPGKDPVHNFMNYSYDICLNQFTPGQVARMDRMWAQWRS
jgi:hypothetical protein